VNVERAVFEKLCAFFHDRFMRSANFSQLVDFASEFRLAAMQNNALLTMFSQKDFIWRR
jgi:hypothetical protein